MKFKNRVDWTFMIIPILLVSGAIFILIGKIESLNFGELLGWFFFSLLPALPIFLLAFKRKGRYEIKDNYLHYNMIYPKGRINISTITKIDANTTKWAGLKAGTSLTGIIIYYNAFDELFISPENQDVFLKMLKEKNPGIEII